jgi:predicted CXXCH cytochrome family protein
MKQKLLVRTGIGLVCAVAASMITVMLVSAQAPRVTGFSQGLDCSACHHELYDDWELGGHGVALSSPTFTEAWQARGEPGDCMACHATGYDPETETCEAEGVTCAVCHSPAAADHPREPMPIARESDTCGACHTQSFFEWQGSPHGEIGLACASCHDPHAADLKADDVSALCSACHGTTVSTYAHSQHFAEGQTCGDCHLAPTGEEPGGGAAQRNHTFAVDLSTCTECHAYQLHSGGENASNEPATDPLSVIGAVDLETSGSPEPVSPLGFALLAALIGMAAGMILAPWLERWYRRMRRDDDAERG